MSYNIYDADGKNIVRHDTEVKTKPKNRSKANTKAVIHDVFLKLANEVKDDDYWLIKLKQWSVGSIDTGFKVKETINGKVLYHNKTLKNKNSSSIYLKDVTIDELKEFYCRHTKEKSLKDIKDSKEKELLKHTDTINGRKEDSNYFKSSFKKIGIAQEYINKYLSERAELYSPQDLEILRSYIMILYNAKCYNSFKFEDGTIGIKDVIDIKYEDGKFILNRNVFGEIENVYKCNKSTENFDEDMMTATTDMKQILGIDEFMKEFSVICKPDF